MKRTPLKRGKPLKRGGPLKRKTRLVPVSKKRRAVSTQRQRMVRDELDQRPQCEAGPVIGSNNQFLSRQCTGRAIELHEPLTRARGGSILDPTNTVAICRMCHNWIHDHPKLATELGLLQHSRSVQ